MSTERVKINRFDFQDLNLIPRKCIVNSRNECNTEIKLNGHTFKLPIVPANMECVINEEVAIKLAKHNYFYIYHRFNNDIIKFANKMKELNLPISISIGVNNDAHEVLFDLAKNNLKPDFITIDIAHGHSIKMEKMLKWIHNFYKDYEKKPYIIAGNVSTKEGVRDLESWGSDAIKVGIGPGSACTTYVATGFGSRLTQASVIEECAKACIKSIIIADGGIKEPGDIAKSLVLGAKIVMIGGMFSALKDSPGEIVIGPDNREYKEFWGSASSFQSGKKDRIEGTKKMLLMKNNSVLDEMKYIHECLQSAISYGGGNNIDCFKDVQYF